MANSTLVGDERQMLNSFCTGDLWIVTDRSHHKELGLATAATHTEVSDGTCILTKLRTLGKEQDL